jgi:hypothetical protein
MKLPRPKTVTGWLILGGLAIYIVWELIVVWLGDRKALISPYVKQAWNYPMLMVACGVIVGHFFIPESRWSHWTYGLAFRQPWLPFLIGVAVAASLWAMRR